jgi:hypothetical protein
LLVINDAILSVRRGPLPCFWPGDCVCPIEKAQQIYISEHVSHGNYFCYVYVTLDGGRQYLLFTLHDAALAREWAARVQGWIDEKRRKKLGLPSPSDAQPRVLESWWSPPERTRRIKVMLSFVAALCGVAALIAAAEYAAVWYRPARQARRH